MADLQLVVRAIGRDELSGPFSVSEGAIGRLGSASGAASVAVGALTVSLAALGGAALAAGAGLTYATKEAGNLQQAVANVASIKPDLDTSAVFSSLNAMQTRVAQTKDQLAASLYDLFSSFDTTQAQALATVEKFAQGAVAAQTDARTFGTAVLGVINAYGLSLEDVNHVQDVFFNTVNKGVVTGQELAASIGLVTQPAKQAGVNLDQLGAYIAAITKEGGPAAQNINNLANYFAKLNTPEAAKGFELLGVRVTEDNGKLRDNIQVLDDLRTRLSNLNQVSASKALQELFPDFQARAGITVLLNQLDFLKDTLKENETEAGSAARAYETMTATFNTQGQLFQQTINSVFTSGGAAFLPVLTEVTSKLQAFVSESAPLFDAFQSRLTDAFKSGGITEWVKTLGDVAGEIGTLIGETWIPAFTDWIEPVKTGIGNALEEVWTGTVSPWIGDRAGDIGKKFTDEWAPALTKWVDETATPAMQTALGKFADSVLAWVDSDGAKAMNDAGGRLITAFVHSFNNLGVQLHNEIQRQVTSAFAGINYPEVTGMTPGSMTGTQGGVPLPGGGPTPTPADMVLIDGHLVSKADAERMAANIGPFLLKPEPAPTEAPGTRTGSGIGTGTEQLDLNQSKADAARAQQEADAAARKAKSEAEAAIRKAEADAKRAAEEAQRAAEQFAALISGFDRVAEEGLSALEQRFGDGSKAAIALSAAMVAGAGQAQGQALASAIGDMAKQARQVGVPQVEELYTAAMDAGRRAIVEGGEANKQAALQSITALGDAIRAQNTLTPETWTQALGLQGAALALGQAGATFFTTFNKAIDEGGQETIRSLAQQRTAMAQTLLNNRDLAPERARELIDGLFSAIDQAVQDRGPESIAHLQQVLTSLNWSVPLEIAQAKLDAAVTKAKQTLDDAIANAERTRDQGIATLRANRGEQEYRAQYLAGIEDEKKAALDMLALVDRARNQSVQQGRENRDRATQYAREDAAQEITRAQQVEDAKARIRQAHDPKHDPLQAKGTTFGFSTDQGGDQELAAMQKQWDREDAIKVTRRAQDTADTNQRRQDQQDDLTWANQYAGMIAVPTDRFNAARDSFTHAVSSADFNNQVLALEATAESAATKAQQAYMASVATAQADYDRVAGMLGAMQQLAGIGLTAMDPVVAGAMQTRDYLKEAAGYLGAVASGAGASGGSSNPAPTEAPPPEPGFATGGSFVVGGSGGTDSQRVAFRATPGERVTVGSGTGGIDYDRLAAAIVNALQGVNVNLDGQTVGKLVTRAQSKQKENTLTYPGGIGLQQNGVGGVGQGGY